nr:lysoplasmalogenase family protein [Corynebacterium xerosis]
MGGVDGRCGVHAPGPAARGRRVRPAADHHLHARRRPGARVRRRAGPARPVGAAGELAEGDPRYGIGHGGNLFLVSDALLMLRALVGEEGVVGKLLDAGVMDTYTAAQLLLVDGILELGRK